MRKYLIGLVIALGIILAGLIIVFGLVLNGTITRQTFEAEKNEISIPTAEASALPTQTPKKQIVVLDPGHGKDSGNMSEEDKSADGWVLSTEKGGWGEWRHWKSGTVWDDCRGSGCSGRHPDGGSCWYPIENGDRDIVPELNLNNTLNAKIYLEDMGYEVRLTRNSNDENPSMTKRLTYCYSGGDTSTEPDADVFVCIHSNAGGGQGSAYMALSGVYDQSGVLAPAEYISESNILGQLINNQIVSDTQLSAFVDGRYEGFPTAVLFCKSPVPIAYLEIGFFDNASDLEVLTNDSETIGRAIAVGVDNYFKTKSN